MLGVPIVCSFRFAKCCFCNLEPAENQSHASERPYTCLCSLLQLKPERSASADLFIMKTVLLKGLAVCFLRNQCKDIHAEASFLIFAFCFVDRVVRVAFVGCVRCLPDFCQRSRPAWERVPVHWVTDTAITCSIQEFRVKIPLKLCLLGVVERVCMEHRACFPGQPKVDSCFSAKQTQGFHKLFCWQLSEVIQQVLQKPSPPEMGKPLFFVFPQHIFQENNSARCINLV